MAVDKNLIAKIHGGFSLRKADGAEVTPKGLKERGLLALLLLQPEQRRSRASLQDMLWSESPPEKGAANLRRALSNIRTALGDEAWRLNANRTSVWMEPVVAIAPARSPGVVLLDDIDIPGSEFEGWLTEVRTQSGYDGRKEVAHLNHAPAQGHKAPEVRIVAPRDGERQQEAFVTDQVASTLAERLQTLGDVRVHIGQDDALVQDSSDTLVSIRTLAHGTEWLVNLQIQARPSMRFLASRHARLPNSSAGIWRHPELVNLINTAIRAIIDHNAIRKATQPYYSIQNAVRRIYSGNRSLVSGAERLLLEAQHADLSGLALAWRGFLRLTEILEFRSSAPETKEAAVAMTEEATVLSPQNPVVWALAAQVQINLCNDLDLGSYCARRSLDCLSDDPYALDAMSTAMVSVGAVDEAHKVAEQALRSAAGLSNEFSWDMQCCLTALGLGRVDDAIGHARAAHLKVPGYRPAVRYLAALNLARGRIEEANKYFDRLRTLEPDFDVDMIVDEDYPLRTFQKLGYSDNLELGRVRS